MTSAAPYIDPARPPSRFRPFKAMKHMRKLLADKDDTVQAFHIIEALNGNSALQDFKQFVASENGPNLLDKRTQLAKMLDDHDPLNQLPEGSVGRAYVTFMEGEDLSAAGLVAESETQRATAPEYDDDLLWYTNRKRDTHDLSHVLSGYGRDLIGENALLAYSHSQHGGRGSNFIVFMSGFKIKKLAPDGIQLDKVIAEARRNGKAARTIIQEDIADLLRESLEAARKRLGIEAPVMYQRALQVLAEHDIDPEVAFA